jgi:hypothetical protein
LAVTVSTTLPNFLGCEIERHAHAVKAANRSDDLEIPGADLNDPGVVGEKAHPRLGEECDDQSDRRTCGPHGRASGPCDLIGTAITPPTMTAAGKPMLPIPRTALPRRLSMQMDRMPRWKNWSRWFDAAGVTDPVAHGPVLNRASMLIDAAVDGQGVALARTALAAWDLINGRLVRPIDVSLRMSNTYWIVCPKATSAFPKITTFRDWLLAEVADDMRRLKTLLS